MCRVCVDCLKKGVKEPFQFSHVPPNFSLKKQVYEVSYRCSNTFGEIANQVVPSVVLNSALPLPNPTYAGSALGNIAAFVWTTTF